MSRNLIEDGVRRTLNQYFDDLGGQDPADLHELVVKAAERPLLCAVLERAQGNQSLAAQWLGINRNTLRRKLLEHGLT